MYDGCHVDVFVRLNGGVCVRNRKRKVRVIAFLQKVGTVTKVLQISSFLHGCEFTLET